MAKMLSDLKDELQHGFLNVVGLVAALGQLAFLAKLFSSETHTNTVYAASLILVAVMAFLFVRSLLDLRRSSLRSRKRRIHKALSVLYAVCALVALSPAGYRWWYIHYPHEPSEEPPEPVIGRLLMGMIAEAHASTPQHALEINMYLDPWKTSFTCTKTRSGRTDAAEAFKVRECAEYSIPSYRLRQLMNGHGLDERAKEREDFDRLYSGTMNAAFQALMTISTYRGKHQPYLDRGPVLMFLFSQKPAWKKTLLDAEVLPNGSEWERLTKEYPDNALALRKFIIDWIGFIDPFFRVSFRNTTSRPIVVSGVRYSADPRRGGTGQATLIGANNIPRYLLELLEGTHETDLHPAVEVPANGFKEIDLQLRLKRPDPGITYDIELEFRSGNPTFVALPAFGLTFMRNR